MNEPERFIGSKGLKGQLLRSAKADEGPGRRRGAILAAAVAVASTTKVASATLTVTTLGRLAVLKWVAIGAIGAGTVVAARVVVPRLASEPARSPASSAATTAAAPRERPAPAPPAERPTIPPAPLQASTPLGPARAGAPLANSPVAPSSPEPSLKAVPAVRAQPRAAAAVAPTLPIEAATVTSPGPASASSRLSDEIAALDRAKRTLKGGDAEETLRQLDAYRTAFPRPVLDAEASALRIEALVRAGRRDDAAALLKELSASHPGSPLLEKLTQTVGE